MDWFSNVGLKEFNPADEVPNHFIKNIDFITESILIIKHEKRNF